MQAGNDMEPEEHVAFCVAGNLALMRVIVAAR